MASKRPAEPRCVSDNETEAEPRSRKRRGPTRRPREPKIAEPPYKAAAEELADAGAARIGSSTADIDDRIIKRIKKCLDRANHPGTPEAEAKAALHLASRLMGQYNVSQAEVLAHEPPSEQRRYAGQSMVAIERTDDQPKAVRIYGYVGTLAEAMQTFFDCKCYSTKFRFAVEWTFYGLAENTVAAAMAFEMAYNTVARWAMRYKGGDRSSYLHGACDELLTMAEERQAADEERARKAERDAIAARAREEDAERQAQLCGLAPVPDLVDGPIRASSPSDPVAAEERNDAEDCSASQHPGSATNPPSPTNSAKLQDVDIDGLPTTPLDDDDEGDEDFEPDFKVEDNDDIAAIKSIDEEILRLIKRERSPTYYPPEPQASPSSGPQPPQFESDEAKPAEKGEPTRGGVLGDAEPRANNSAVSRPPSPAPGEPRWESHMQLVMFRKTATKIADDYLKEQGIKVRAGASRSFNVRNWAVYQHGVVDGRKIDVHKKSIGD